MENAFETSEEDLDKFLDKIKNEYKDGWSEQNWENEMAKHPFFMTKLPENEQDFTPELEALRQIQWDENETPEIKANKYKEEGNMMFKNKVYKKAVQSYTMALKQDINDTNNKEHKELISVLHSNRAAAHFYLGNFRSALNDCIFAYKCNPMNLKPVIKAAECCYELKLHDDCVRWCEIALAIDKNFQKATDLLIKAQTTKKTHEKEKRKKEATERKRTEFQKLLLELIKAKKLTIQEKDNEFIKILETQTEFPISVSEGENPSIIWPVVFLYPEYGQTDFIQSFDENAKFDDQLRAMFAESPAWDTDKKYTYDSVELFYEDQKSHRLVKLKKSCTLLEALRKEGYIIQMGTPKFVLMVKNSDFAKIYQEKYAELNR